MKAHPIRVLQCLRCMNRTGLETWLMHLLRHLDRSEVAIDFLVQTGTPGAFDEEIRSLGAAIFPCARTSQPWLYTRNFLRILRDHGPYDVVHSQNYFFAGLDLRLAAFAGVGKRIAHIHPVRDLKAEAPFRWFYRTLMSRWIAKNATLMLAPSQASLDAFGNTGTPQQVVHNCVGLAPYSSPFDRESVRRELGLPLDRPVIKWVINRLISAGTSLPMTDRACELRMRSWLAGWQAGPGRRRGGPAVRVRRNISRTC